MPKGIYIRTDEMKKNIKNIFKKGHEGYKGMLGKHHSLESKKLLKEANLRRKAKLGYIVSPEARKKLSLVGKGHRVSEETRQKISMANKGHIMPEKQKQILLKCHLGKKLSEEHKLKISLSHRGEKAYQWLGGISKNPYPREFNPELKLRTRQKYSFTCCLCGRTEREELEELNRVLCVNHIDFDKNNCKENNLNVLCCRCNVKINRNREYWTSYFQGAM